MFTNKSYSLLTAIALLLSSVGAINWGLIAGFDFNLVEFLFGNYPLVIKAIYSLVGLSGLYSLLPAWNITCSAKERIL
jgi:uncharacterized membrane protein YuzA (DUF378 family)